MPLERNIAFTPLHPETLSFHQDREGHFQQHSYEANLAPACTDSNSWHLHR